MELRLQLRARVTGDYDAAFRARTEEVIDRLDEALAQPWNHFNLTRDAPETIRNTKAVRVRLRLSYKGRTWGSVQLEMAPCTTAGTFRSPSWPARTASHPKTSTRRQWL
jgi:hypothetical protein